MKILYYKEIKALVKELDLMPLIKEGFIAYSEGRSVVPVSYTHLTLPTKA